VTLPVSEPHVAVDAWAAGPNVRADAANSAAHNAARDHRRLRANNSPSTLPS